MDLVWENATKPPANQESTANAYRQGRPKLGEFAQNAVQLEAGLRKSRLRRRRHGRSARSRENQDRRRGRRSSKAASLRATARRERAPAERTGRGRVPAGGLTGRSLAAAQTRHIRRGPFGVRPRKALEYLAFAAQHELDPHPRCEDAEENDGPPSSQSGRPSEAERRARKAWQGNRASILASPCFKESAKVVLMPSGRRGREEQGDRELFAGPIEAWGRSFAGLGRSRRQTQHERRRKNAATLETPLSLRSAIY